MKYYVVFNKEEGIVSICEAACSLSTHNDYFLGTLADAEVALNALEINIQPILDYIKLK